MEILTYIFMLLALLCFGLRSYKLSLGFYVLNTLALVALFAILAGEYHASELSHWAITSFVTKAVLVPAILFYTLKKAGEPNESEPIGGFLFSIVIACGVSIGVAVIFAPVFEPFAMIKNSLLLKASIFVFMIGLSFFILRTSFFKQIIGYCLIEHGIHLSLALNAYNASALAEIGIVSDAIFCVIVMCVLSLKYRAIFGSFSNVEATHLRG